MGDVEMKKLRNIFCAALALLLAMSCAACSKSADDETASGAESDTQVTVISADGTTAKTVISNDGGTLAQNGETKINPRRAETMLGSRKTRPAARVSAKPCASR